jgi:hypothetical protein
MKKYFGYLKFDPIPIKDPSGKMFKEWWLIVQIPGELGDYYRFLLEKEHGLYTWNSYQSNLYTQEKLHLGLKIQRPAWGAHISVIRGETPLTEDPYQTWSTFKDQYDGQEIMFDYELQPKTNGRHWWLKIFAPELNTLRSAMGYPAHGLFGLHLTLGIPTPSTMDYSFQIWKEYLNSQKEPK